MIRKLLSYVKEYRKASLLAPMLIAAEVLLEIMIPFLMASIVDKGLSEGNIGHILKIGKLTLVFAMSSLLVGILAGRYAAKASAGFAKNLRKALFYKIQEFSFSNIDKFSTAGLVTRFTTDVNNIQNSYQMILRIFVRAPFMLVFATLMTVLISGRLSLIYIGTVIFLAALLVILTLKMYPVFAKAVAKYDSINSNLQENISAIRVVKAYVREKFEIDKFRKSTEDLRDTNLKGEKIFIFIPPAMYLSFSICNLMLSWFGARMVISSELTTGQLMSLFAYTANILISLMMFAFVIVTLTFSKASAERIVAVLNEEPSIKNRSNPVMKINDGSIKFENVNFSYTDNPEVKNLENINIEIKSGETVGIIGGTGSAKSAFVQLIPRLYDVLDGELYVSGVNVKDYDLKVLRDNVAMVLQKNVLFSGTISENLRWGKKDATDEEIMNVCKLAQADEFIQRFPDKYSTYIEQGGTNLSGGQKQRLCIARALLKNPKILILDDSMSAVDTKTDALLRKALHEEVPSITKIIVAQRISSVREADRIIVLDDGKIDGTGTHETLLKENRIYQEVYYSQVKGGKDEE